MTKIGGGRKAIAKNADEAAPAIPEVYRPRLQAIRSGALRTFLDCGSDRPG